MLRRSRFPLILILTLLCSCAGMRPGYESPSVSLRSFRYLPQDGISPRFEIGLHLVNPNKTALPLNGIFYTVKIEGHKVLTGVANDLPTVEPYGEADILLEASVDLLQGVGLFQTLLTQPQTSLKYVFDAKLDVGAAFGSDVRIQEKGQFLPDR